MGQISPQQKAQLIRQANRAFSEGRVHTAARIFKQLKYKDGLIRIGDYLYHEKQQPLWAYGYYRMAGHKPMIQKISDGFVFALKCLLWEDPPFYSPKNSPPPQLASEDQLEKATKLIRERSH